MTDRQDRAVAIAGRLAELGETRLTLHEVDRPARALAVRASDLPGLMLSVAGYLEAETLGVRVTLGPSGPQPADARAASVLGLAFGEK